ncbi:hypothetical protein Cni_G14417 [Canna indica]|uniref:Uncharacterized protein n=1 Tax=Canna indica TaxID=4628 RepID=A0AAQ3KBG1_9LILI|nr:hypothetical protein Cni_G14417 [Canna indica]
MKTRQWLEVVLQQHCQKKIRPSNIDENFIKSNKNTMDIISIVAPSIVGTRKANINKTNMRNKVSKASNRSIYFKRSTTNFVGSINNIVKISTYHPRITRLIN